MREQYSLPIFGYSLRIIVEHLVSAPGWDLKIPTSSVQEFNFLTIPLLKSDTQKIHTNSFNGGH